MPKQRAAALKKAVMPARSRVYDRAPAAAGAHGIGQERSGRCGEEEAMEVSAGLGCRDDKARKLPETCRLDSGNGVGDVP